MNVETARLTVGEDGRSDAPQGSWRPATLIIALVAVAVLALFFFFRRPAATAAPAPPTVVVGAPISRQITQWDDYVGRFEPSRTVEIRPRVAGQITSVNFVDGAMVRQGQLLFTIDKRPFAAALAEAQAGLASARSDLALAQADLARAGRLIGDEALSKSELDRLRARAQAAQAGVAGGEARVRERALDIEFADVRAPIAGRVSNRRVDPGNLVMGGEGTGGSLLTTINALDPIYFSFDASEAQFLNAKRAVEAGEAPTQVDVRLQDEADYRWHGRLDFIDNGLNPRAGTVKARATLSNPKLFLTPGMFGNMRLASGSRTAALLVPDASVQTDQARRTVLVVDKNNVVAAKPVELGPVVDGLRVIRSGLAADDRVVISGMQSATPGSKVQTKPGHIAPVAAPAQPVDLPSGAEATFAS